MRLTLEDLAMTQVLNLVVGASVSKSVSRPQDSMKYGTLFFDFTTRGIGAVYERVGNNRRDDDYKVVNVTSSTNSLTRLMETGCWQLRSRLDSVPCAQYCILPFDVFL